MKRYSAHVLTPPFSIHSQVDDAVAEFFYLCGISFNTASQSAFQTMLTKVAAAGRAYQPPDRKKLAGPLLDNAEERIDTLLRRALKTAGNSGGATLVTDGLTHLSRPFTNMLVVSPTFGVRSLGVIDSTDHLGEGGTKNACYIADQLCNAITALPRGSISLVVTDGASAMVGALSILRVEHPTVATAICLSHVMNNFFKDVGAISAIKTLVSKGQKISDTFKNREKPRAVLHTYSVRHLGRALGVVVGADTRFGTYFIVLHRLRRLRRALEAAVADPAMVDMAEAERRVGEVVDFIKDPVFWADVDLVVESLWPAMLLLRLLDSDKPVMSIALHAWRRLSFKLKDTVATVQWGDGSDQQRTVGKDEMEEILACLENRSSSFGPIHHAAYLVNPALWDISSTDDEMVLEGFKQYCSIVFAEDEDGDAKKERALEGVLKFKRREGKFGEGALMKAAKRVGVSAAMTRPGDWWHLHGHPAPELRTVAMRALGQVASIGAAERGHKTHKFLQTKVRNRMSSATVDKLIKVHVGLRAQEKLNADTAEPDDARLVAAVAAIDQWWAEELGFMEMEPSLTDWGVGERSGESMRDSSLKLFNAWKEAWEGEAVGQRTDVARQMLLRKYKGMKLRIVDDGVEETREVVDIVWDTNVRPRCWRVRAVPHSVGYGVQETNGQADDAINLDVEDACHFIVEAADLNPLYRIKYTA